MLIIIIIGQMLEFARPEPQKTEQGIEADKQRATPRKFERGRCIGVHQFRLTHTRPKFTIILEWLSKREPLWDKSSNEKLRGGLPDL